ncbi:MAG: phosphatidate cytidylyltransferase [Chloroflexi bacterium]|nr:phosphatidate cytidylyltransferase [Chloroflexota bacterium]
MLRQRVLSAVVLIPLVALIWWVGGWWYTGFIALFTLVATWELLHLLQRESFFTPITPFALLITAWLVLEAGLPANSERFQLLLVLSILAGLVIALFLPRPHAASDLLLSLAAAIYLGFTLRFLVSLRLLPDNGLQWVALAALTTWLTDTGAYFVGLGIGKHKLWPRISPKKTWEGWFGGLFVGTIAASLLAPLLIPSLSSWQGVLIGLTVGIGGPFGDLSESLFKRQVGAKDSSHLIPGHGGFFDRVDSFIFVGPLLYLLALLWA